MYASLIIGIVSLITSIATSAASAGSSKKAVRQQNELLEEQDQLLQKDAKHGRDIASRNLDRSKQSDRLTKSLWQKQNAMNEADLLDNAKRQKGAIQAKNISSIGSNMTGGKIDKATKSLMRLG